MKIRSPTKREKKERIRIKITITIKVNPYGSHIRPAPSAFFSRLLSLTMAGVYSGSESL